MTKRVKKLGTDIATKSKSQQKFLEDEISSLKKYVDQMHEEQIEQFNSLKNLATEAATGIDVQKQVSQENTQDRGFSSLKSPRSKKAQAKVVLDDEFHAQCAKDYLVICNEQLRQDMAINQLNTLVLDLIRINLQRETVAPGV